MDFSLYRLYLKAYYLTALDRQDQLSWPEGKSNQELEALCHGINDAKRKDFPDPAEEWGKVL